MKNWDFGIGDWVKRRVDVFDDSSPYRKGTVIKRYSKDSERFGYYPELYDVEWEDGSVGKEYLPWGIQRREK